jgi:hypothetical protein
MAINPLDDWRRNRIMGSYDFRAPAAPSTQTSGAVAPVWRIAEVKSQIVVNGVLSGAAYAAFPWVAANPSALSTGAEFVVGSDYCWPRFIPPILSIGQSVVCAIVAVSFWLDTTHDADSLWIMGTPATTGQEQVPSDASIKAFMVEDGDDPGYIRIAKITLNRTGDTALSQFIDNTWRDV